MTQHSASHQSEELRAGVSAAASDEMLMAAVQNGESRAFHLLVERHYGAMRSYALRLLGTPESADDLTQETFLRVLEAGHQFDTSRSFKPWLYQIARNRYRDRLRSAECRRTTLTDSPPEPAERTSPVELRLLRREDQRQVQAALQQLDDNAREVLLLRFQSEFAIKDIAAILDIPEGTVKSRIYYGLKKLSRLLEGSGNPQTLSRRKRGQGGRVG